MKVVLLITVCSQNITRIQNQISNLKKNQPVNEIELIPIFVFGTSSLPTPNTDPYIKLKMPVEEKYTNLYFKLFHAYRYIHEKVDYDFIWKIDDDTLINPQFLDSNMLRGYDYIGRLTTSNTYMNMSIEADIYGEKKKIYLIPECLNSGITFASGDSYFLSKRAVDTIVSKSVIIDLIKTFNRIPEDRLFGFMLSYNKSLVYKNISKTDKIIEVNKLQVTENYLSIHPINENIFSDLIYKTPQEQISEIIIHRYTHLDKRQAYLTDLENRLMKTFTDFLNEKKDLGLC